ncbi:molybdenum cofactor biosynthesis protein MoaE [Sphingosinicella terrae]|uniref:molybdenum cofactor biosynthesis protein MoaE n=1 Tax=Sphingosinicella terrae TaxID=2172047 RepID=UPI000E0D9EF5|nr:molybdenum cofactor biosynthesis protein MoaE [Sphingosinicella terrae]
MIDIRIQSADFDAGAQIERLAELRLAGLAAFVARLEAREDVDEIWIDHHAVLARAELARIVEEAGAKWRLGGLVLIHRHGRIAPGGQALFAGATGSSAGAAQQACAWIVDQVRGRGPFWRKDVLGDGAIRWWGPPPDAR